MLRGISVEDIIRRICLLFDFWIIGFECKINFSRIKWLVLNELISVLICSDKRVTDVEISEMK